MKSKPLILNLCLVGGYVSLVYGCGLYSLPLGFIVGGMGAMSFALQCRKTDRSENDG